MNGLRDFCSSSGSVMIGVSPADEDDNAALSSEDSSCPDDLVSGTELDLALGLGIGLNSRRNHSKTRSSSSSLASSSSSLTRESGTKRSADSSAAPSKGQVAVGWPPLRTYRINSLVNQAKSLATEDGLCSDIQKDTTKNGVVAAKNYDACFIKSTKTPMLVKVTMDGVIIGRKVDLNALDSYQGLAKTLEQMFFQIPSSVTRSDTQECKTIKETHASELLEGSSEYIITYQDKDEDWMLVGDVPWQMFLGSVKRLRIMRTSSETGIGK
ncbi:auxin-responsive protein IAA10 isoform X2 [Eutrema salsugineum]|uniref:auxin-responsive protein IAA10 isoform X2 n=1 Tax=Eutrema salsugineum TaxID=72664 RepID=UPI000CECF2F6|nr:auxin-responsive protein IAA10 isoform X2 [Eutrema salsugineum]